MALKTDISGYFSGEPFLVDAALVDQAGDPITTGAMTLQLAREPGAISVADVAGTHEGEGTWRFDVGVLDEGFGPRAFYEIQDNFGFVLAYGVVFVTQTIRNS